MSIPIMAKLLQNTVANLPCLPYHKNYRGYNYEKWNKTECLKSHTSKTPLTAGGLKNIVYIVSFKIKKNNIFRQKMKRTETAHLPSSSSPLPTVL